MPLVTLEPTSSTEQEETIQTFVTEVAENTPANTVVVTLGVGYPPDLNTGTVV